MPLIDLEMPDQGPSNWCWAAVTAALANTLRGANLTPCEVAEQILATGTCCEEPFDPGNNQVLELDDALVPFGLLRAPVIEQDIGFEQLAGEIAANRPVAIRELFLNGVAHFVLAIGFTDENSILVKDPSGPTEVELSMVRLKFDYPGGGAWTHTYLVG